MKHRGKSISRARPWRSLASPEKWPAYTYRDRYVIWGLTYRILTRLWTLIG